MKDENEYHLGKGERKDQEDWIAVILKDWERQDGGRRETEDKAMERYGGDYEMNNIGNVRRMRKTAPKHNTDLRKLTISSNVFSMVSLQIYKQISNVNEECRK